MSGIIHQYNSEQLDKPPPSVLPQFPDTTIVQCFINLNDSVRDTFHYSVRYMRLSQYAIIYFNKIYEAWNKSNLVEPRKGLLGVLDSRC